MTGTRSCSRSTSSLGVVVMMLHETVEVEKRVQALEEKNGARPGENARGPAMNVLGIGARITKVEDKAVWKEPIVTAVIHDGESEDDAMKSLMSGSAAARIGPKTLVVFIKRATRASLCTRYATN